MLNLTLKVYRKTSIFIMVNLTFPIVKKNWKRFIILIGNVSSFFLIFLSRLPSSRCSAAC